MTVLPCHECIKKKEGTAWNFKSAIDQELLDIFGCPSKHEFFMCDIIPPLASLTKELFDLAPRSVKQNRKAISNNSFELFCCEYYLIYTNSAGLSLVAWSYFKNGSLHPRCSRYIIALYKTADPQSHFVRC